MLNILFAQSWFETGSEMELKMKLVAGLFLPLAVVLALAAIGKTIEGIVWLCRRQG